jgi:hypothetical protein
VKAAIAVAIVAVVVFAVLAAGLVPGVSLFSKSGSAGTSVSSSSSALAAAGPVAAAHGAGALVLAVGASTTFSFPFGSEAGNTSCPVTGGIASNFTVGAATGNYSSGEATVWIFLYSNSSAVTLSAIAVVGSSSYFLGTVTGASCVGSLSLTPIPAGYVDSARAAKSADADAGSFLSADSRANVVYALLDNGTAGPEWYVVYTNCSYNVTTAEFTGGDHGNLFAGVVNASTGDLITGGASMGNLNCSSLSVTNVTGSQPYALGMYEISSNNVGATYYTDLGLSPTAGLSTNLFGFVLRNSVAVVQAPAAVPLACAYGAAPGSCVAGTGWYAVLVAVNGTVVGTYGNSTPGWGNLAPHSTNITITSGLTLVIVSNTQYAGNAYTLTAFGTGTSSVSGSANL